MLMLGYGTITTSALNYLCRELCIHIQLYPDIANDVKLILKRLRFAHHILLIMTILMGFSTFIFCFGKFRNLSSYFFIWLLTSWPLCATIVILTVSRISRVNRSENNENSFPPVSRNIEQLEIINDFETPERML